MFELFIAIAVQLLAAVLAPTPKPPAARRYSLNEFEMPTATEDRALPMGFGTFRVAGNVVWYGDYYAEEVSKRVRVSPFKKAKQSLGYRYHVGLWMTLCAAPADELTEVWLGERLVWSGSLPLSKTAVTALDVDASWTSAEGQELAEGMRGRLSFFNHQVRDSAAFTPLPNAYLAGQLGETPPAYPNTLHVVWHGASDGRRGFISTGPQLAPLRFTLRRRPDIVDALGGTSRDFRQLTFPYTGSVNMNSFTRAQFDAWIAERSLVDGDANPALALLEILTTRVPGVGPRLNTQTFNVESFLRAADRLAQEAHGVSACWESTRPIGDVAADICRQINAYLEQNERTGAIQLKLLREDDTPVALFNDSNVEELSSFSRVAAEEAVNEVHVPYIDRGLGWIERVQVAQNAAGIRAAGSSIVRQSEFFGVSRPGLASILATRELRTLGSSLAKARWSGWVEDGVVLKPGDLVQLTHSPLGQTLRMRVLSARTGNWDARGRVEIEAIEDVFRSGSADQAVVLPTPAVPVYSPPASLVNAQLLLAPYALTGDDQDHLLYVAEDPGTSTTAYQLAVQERVATWTPAVEAEYSSDTQEPAIAATLNAALASTDTVPSLALTLSSTALEQWQRGYRGELYVVAGGEWMSCSSWSLAGSVLTARSVNRGIFDTVPGAFAAGQRVLLLLGFTLDEARLRTAVTDSVNLGGIEAAACRADSLGPAGRTSATENATSQATWTYTPAGSRAPKPLLPGSVSLAGRFPALSSSETAPTLTRAASAQLTWRNRNRLARQLAPYYTATNDIEPGTTTRYALRWEISPGVWSSAGYITTAAGATTAAVDLSSVPAGARRIRLDLLSVRTVGGSECTSAIVQAFWQLTS